LLSVVSTLAMGACPPVLERFFHDDDPHSREGLSSKVEHIRQAVETSCGRNNFTTAFWSSHLTIETMMLLAHNIVSKEINGPTDQRTELIPFQPLLDTVFEKFKSMENVEAKNYIDSNCQAFTQSKIPLRPEARIAFVQMMKSAFGGDTGNEKGQNQHCNAGAAFERTENGKSNTTAIAQLIDEIQSITNFTSALPLRNPFEENNLQLSKWMVKHENHTGIGPLEVVPAVETLYLQYKTQNNTEAKQYV
ncbi:hypothetical protein PENTCL1PPCAC_29137, partial [Pristionchus entomophagus]